jgi:anti-sigma factor RsiW
MPREVFNMRCRMEKKLADYQVGALDAAQRFAVEQHLHHCAACRAELQALHRTVILLQPMPQVDAPREVWAHVARQLTPRRRTARIVRWAPAMAAAMVLLIVALAVVLPLLHGHLPGVQPPDAYADMQLVAAWGSPMSDKAALGLAVLATSDRESDFIQEVVD